LGGAPAMVSVKRDKITLKDQEAQSRIIDFGKEPKIRVGIIKLDSFYFDWNAAENGSKEPKSSTSDVKKILESFKKENVDGIVMDLRSNGGGSLFEAVSLSGLFIKDGPIVQARSKEGRADVKRDEDSTILYSGPMLVMVNKLSASATEIFAGAIRDYGRGIIVGDSQTHGKGSVQTVVGLNEFLKYWGINSDAGSVKITNAKFYRINGESTQQKGISPDILIPALTDSMDVGESKIRNSLEWDRIPSVKFEAWMDEENLNRTITILRNRSRLRLENDSDFINLKKTIEQYKKFKDRKTVSLNIDKRFKSYAEDMEIMNEHEKILGISEESPDDSPEGKIDPKNDIQLRETLNIIFDYIRLSDRQNGERILL